LDGASRELVADFATSQRPDHNVRASIPLLTIVTK
jgi:hypothetical protein